MKKQSCIISFLLVGIIIFYGCEKEEPPIPVVHTRAISNVTAITALSGGTIISYAGSTITARGVCWSTDPDPKITDSKTIDGSLAGSFKSELTGLTPVTSYYIRAYATNDIGTSYGMTYTFTTLDGLGGIITTTEVTEIATVSAQSGGSISYDGGAPITVRGVVWDTIPDPNLDNNIGFTTDGDSIGSFISVMEGLTPATIYYVRSYATNAVTTKYGMSLSFTTLGQKPSATTLSASNVIQTSAKLNGIINANYLNTTVAFEYGLTTDYGNTVIAIPSTVSGNTNTNVSAEISGLIPRTKYHYRVYAENELGISYGADKVFSKHGTGTFTDSRDGNVYQTIAINDQVWMAENLKYLPRVVGSSTGSPTDSYYYVNGYEGYNVTDAKATANYQTYGVLYNWPAALQACPTGWHLPTDAEWISLINYLIANGFNYDGTTTGNKIAKSMATSSGWSMYIHPGTVGNPDYPDKRNTTGFSALPGGSRNFKAFVSPGRHCHWWSALEDGSSYAWGRSLLYNTSGLGRSSYGREGGISVRCIKD